MVLDGGGGETDVAPRGHVTTSGDILVITTHGVLETSRGQESCCTPGNGQGSPRRHEESSGTRSTEMEERCPKFPIIYTA